jgi:hypothetical protein
LQYPRLFEEEAEAQARAAPSARGAPPQDAGAAAERFETAAGGAPPGGARPCGALFQGVEGGAPGGLPARPRARAGFTSNADGLRLPFGPEVEFRIIDFGSSTFNEDLAQAAGGFRSRAAFQSLAQLFEAAEVTSAGVRRWAVLACAPGFRLGACACGFALKGEGEGEGEGGSVGAAAPRAAAGKGGKGGRPGWKGRVMRVAGAVPLRGAAWHLVLTAVKDRYQMQAAPAGTRPLTPAEARVAAQAHVWDRLDLNAPAPAPAAPTPRASSPRTSSSGTGGAAAGSLGAGSGRASSLPPPAHSAARLGLIEKAYRHFWRRKGDVFHLLLCVQLRPWSASRSIQRPGNQPTDEPLANYRPLPKIQLQEPRLCARRPRLAGRRQGPGPPPRLADPPQHRRPPARLVYGVGRAARLRVLGPTRPRDAAARARRALRAQGRGALGVAHVADPLGGARAPVQPEIDRCGGARLALLLGGRRAAAAAARGRAARRGLPALLRRARGRERWRGQGRRRRARTSRRARASARAWWRRRRCSAPRSTRRPAAATERRRRRC